MDALILIGGGLICAIALAMVGVAVAILIRDGRGRHR